MSEKEIFLVLGALAIGAWLITSALKTTKELKETERKTIQKHLESDDENVTALEGESRSEMEHAHKCLFCGARMRAGSTVCDSCGRRID